MLITRHCGNKTLHLFAALIHDIIRRQHKHVTERTLSKAGVDKLRQGSIRSREKALELMRSGMAAEAERFWRAHLEHMRDLVLSVYKAPMTIDVLNEPIGKLRRGRQREAARAAGCEGRLTRIGPGNCRHRTTAELAEPRPTSLRCRNLDGHLRFSRHAMSPSNSVSYSALVFCASSSVTNAHTA